MQVLESSWIRARLAEVPDEELFPLLDVGSSTLEFRTQVQPYIESEVFAPLARRGGRVWHADIKPAPGVDLVGDLLDPDFQERLRALGVRSALVCNVLHHVTDAERLCAAIAAVVRPKGRVILSGPHRFPRHFDPIDTLFRPDLAQVAALFPQASLEAGEILDCGNWRQWRAAERGGRSFPRAFARLFTPFYRPRKWLELACEAPYFVRHVRTFVAVLRLP
ncbi:MAG: hypothetical protein JNK02_03920 [Planctomycetes bacterium]|nr:hypothetical protein [Planctomycetota bacterium]